MATNHTETDYEGSIARIETSGGKVIELQYADGAKSNHPVRRIMNKINGGHRKIINIDGSAHVVFTREDIERNCLKHNVPQVTVRQLYNQMGLEYEEVY